MTGHASAGYLGNMRTDQIPLPDGQIDQLQVSHQEPRRLPGRPHRQTFRPELDRKLQAFKAVLPEALLERFTGFLSDEDYLSLEGEIATVRTLFTHMLAAWKEYVETCVFDGDTDPPKPPFTVSQLMQGAEQVSKLVERQHRILYSDANLITVEAAVAFALSVAEVVNTYVRSPEERGAVLGAIRKLLVGNQSFTVSTQVSQRLLSAGPVQDGEFREIQEGT